MLATRHQAVREPKQQTWLRSGQPLPTDGVSSRSLIDTAFAGLPILGDASSTPSGASFLHR